MMNNIEKRISEFLRIFDFGEDNQEVMKNTPKRVKNFVNEFFNVAKPRLKKIKVNSNGTLKIEGIKFYALCQHHLLPFFGTVDIEIEPNKYLLGLSKYARVVDYISRQRPTLQEKLAYEIASFLKNELKPQKVKVTVKARHLCIEMRGIKKEVENKYECEL